MDFVEYQGKAILAETGVPVPRGIHCTSVNAVVKAVEELGPSAVKAQVPIGKRGKAGGIRLVSDAAEAKTAAEEILALKIGGYTVESLLVEQKAPIAREFYAAVMNDLGARAPTVLFSPEGGMDIEELAAEKPEAICRIPVDIECGLDAAEAAKALGGMESVELGDLAGPLSDFLAQLYVVYMEYDVELLEINPLALLENGNLVALDCKLTIDDSAAFRQTTAAERAAPEPKTDLEARGSELGFKFIELDGKVGVLANGAGLTMTTMDVVGHYGGQAANFLEIGGDAYTKATPALELVLDNPEVKSLIVNFCGAFARTDVMTEGVIKAWETLKPEVPVFFSIHGTGEDDAVAMLQSRLNITPHDRMEDAIEAAVEAAK